MLRKISKLFFWFFFAGLLSALILLCVHIYWGDKSYDAGRYFYPPQSEFLNKNIDEFSIAVVSDTGANDIVLKTILDEIVETKPRYDFVLHLGDFLTHRTDKGLQWLLYEIKPKLKNIPLYCVPGNHDITKHENRDIIPYKSVLGATYYWFGYGNVLFIAMDTSFETIDDRQLEWLENTLKNIRPLFKHCVIYSHVPPYDILPDIISGHSLDGASAKKFYNIVKKYKIDFMIFGHVHYYAKGSFAGIPIYTVPSSGQIIRDKNNKYGYVSIDFNKKGLKNIQPKYINFKGPEREYIEYTIARDIFHHKLHETISYIMIPGLFFLGLSLLCRFVAWIIDFAKQRKEKR